MFLFPEAVGQIYNGQQTLHFPSLSTSLGQRELHTQSKRDNFYFRKQKLHETISQTIFKVQQQQRYEVTVYLLSLYTRTLSDLLFVFVNLLFVLQLDLDDLHSVDVGVVPGCHVDAVQACEVHPVRALGLPVH